MTAAPSWILSRSATEAVETYYRHALEVKYGQPRRPKPQTLNPYTVIHASAPKPFNSEPLHLNPMLQLLGLAWGILTNARPSRQGPQGHYCYHDCYFHYCYYYCYYYYVYSHYWCYYFYYCY